MKPILIALLLLIVGCTTSSRKAFYQTYPELKPERRHATLDQALAKRITTDEARASWGAPQSTGLTSIRIEVWDYPGFTLFFRDGEVFPKQQKLILKLVLEHQLDKQHVEHISMRLFGIGIKQQWQEKKMTRLTSDD